MKSSFNAKLRTFCFLGFVFLNLSHGLAGRPTMVRRNTSMASLSLSSPTNPLGLIQIDSLDDNGLCGKQSTGASICFDSRGTILPIPDTFSQIDFPIANSTFGCGYVGGIAKCWNFADGTDPRDTLNQLKPGTIKTAPRAFCGISKNDPSQLICSMGDWYYSNADQRIQLKQNVGAFGLSGSAICWSENSEVQCLRDRSQTMPVPFLQKDTIEIAASEDSWVCARSATEATCQTSKGMVTLAPEALSARSGSWTGAGAFLCAILQDDRIGCFDTSSGALRDPKDNYIPKELSQPGSNIAYFTGSQSWGNLCVNKTNSRNVLCWSPNFSSSPTSFAFREIPVSVFGNGEVVCAVLKSGQIECGGEIWHQSLDPKFPLNFVFYYRNAVTWNQTGSSVRINLLPQNFDKISALRGINGSYCAIGISSADSATVSADKAYCTSPLEKINMVPNNIPQDSTLIATAGERACIANDKSMLCWGNSFKGIFPPSDLFNPTQLELSSGYGCAIDQFGLTCFGDLTTESLTPPNGINSPNRLKKIALAPREICGVKMDNTLECWGSGVTDSQAIAPPQLYSVTSIAVSHSGTFCALGKLTATQIENDFVCWGNKSNFLKSFTPSY